MADLLAGGVMGAGRRWESWAAWGRKARFAYGEDVTPSPQGPCEHARTATGAAQLPFGAAVQLDMIVRLRAP